jgi:hypothetical protein
LGIDDDIQWDPATFPENQPLVELNREMRALNEQRAREEARRLALCATVATAVRGAAAGIEQAVVARAGPYAREEELRGGAVSALRSRDELVLTEAKLAVPGWTANLGGFDFAWVLRDGDLVIGETKWADGNLGECMWDILKLASASMLPRIRAAVAVYGAPVKHWQRAGTCAQLFEERVVSSRSLIEAFPKDWKKNLAGSTAKPLELPMQIHLNVIDTQPVEVLGKAWEVRTLAVSGDNPTYPLEDGWPHRGPPAEPIPLT